MNEVVDTAESVVRGFLASLADFDPDHLVSFFGDDAVLVDGPRHVECRGIEAIEHELHEQKAVGTTAVVDVKAIVSDGRVVMVERVDNVTFGETRFAMNIVGVFEVGPAGKIQRWTEYYDLKTVLDTLEAANAR